MSGGSVIKLLYKGKGDKSNPKSYMGVQTAHQANSTENERPDGANVI